jgi:hypothetical protein
MFKKFDLLKVLPALAFFLLVLLPSCGPAVPFITVGELKQQIDSGAMVSIVDVRRQDDYEVDHIKGALSMPMVNISSGLWQPPKNTGWVFAFYCS